MTETNPREALRLRFAETALARPLMQTVASADASFRSYYRVRDAAADSWIVMDAPPEKEDCAPFIDISRRLREVGVAAPAVLAQDTQRGFLLLTDLGDRQLLPALDTTSVESLYADAMQELLCIQRADCTGLPQYDAERLRAEMDLFPHWFVARHLGASMQHFGDRFAHVQQLLIENALSQPQGFVHRDFHSRNLMLGARHPQASDRFGVLDFQDAVRGPLAYDLVSLLRDCYIVWPHADVQRWTQAFWHNAALPNRSAEQFQRDVDWLGVQRHLKVLGIFARLNYRDGKARYLADLPRVLRYTLEVCALYPELAGFGAQLQQLCADTDLTQARLSNA
jgi:N-acetylmuramate 1-kinase